MVDQAKLRSYNTASKFKRGYQSMIGALQWMVTIGQPNITTAVMTMSNFRLAPRNGHLEMVKPKNGYVWQFMSVLMRQIATIYRKLKMNNQNSCMGRFQN
jgi:hypothetical protein